MPMEGSFNKTPDQKIDSKPLSEDEQDEIDAQKGLELLKAMKKRKGEDLSDSLKGISDGLNEKRQVGIGDEEFHEAMKGIKKLQEMKGIVDVEANEKERNCPKCGAKVDAGDKFCGMCSAKLEEIKVESKEKELNCPKCGARVDAGDKFCGMCSAKLEGIKDSKDNNSETSISEEEQDKIDQQEGLEILRRMKQAKGEKMPDSLQGLTDSVEEGGSPIKNGSEDFQDAIKGIEKLNEMKGPGNVEGGKVNNLSENTKDTAEQELATAQLAEDIARDKEESAKKVEELMKKHGFTQTKRAEEIGGNFNKSQSEIGMSKANEKEAEKVDAKREKNSLNMLVRKCNLIAKEGYIQDEEDLNAVNKQIGAIVNNLGENHPVRKFYESINDPSKRAELVSNLVKLGSIAKEHSE